jgi:hypothetical protein
MRCGRLVVDCGSVERPSLTTIDNLCRLQLDTRRCGTELKLQNANPCLIELIELAGLGAVLCVQPRGQAEEREHPGRVEEEGELGDAAI